ncbi:hypothetical protein D3C85_1507220 [compost metagenome]
MGVSAQAASTAEPASVAEDGLLTCAEWPSAAAVTGKVASAVFHVQLVRSAMPSTPSERRTAAVTVCAAAPAVRVRLAGDRVSVYDLAGAACTTRWVTEVARVPSASVAVAVISTSPAFRVWTVA